MLSYLNSLYFLVLPLLAFSSFTSLSAGDGSAPYVQLSSFQTQLSGVVNPTENHFLMMRNVDAISGIALQNTAFTKIDIKQHGTYFVTVSGQVGAALHSHSALGYVDLWLVKNGHPVPNSCARQHIDHKHGTAILTTQAVMPLHAGDSLSVAYSSNSASLGLIATPPTEKQPAIPSVLFSLFQIR